MMQRAQPSKVCDAVQMMAGGAAVPQAPAPAHLACGLPLKAPALQCARGETGSLKSSNPAGVEGATGGGGES